MSLKSTNESNAYEQGRRDGLTLAVDIIIKLVNSENQLKGSDAIIKIMEERQ